MLSQVIKPKEHDLGRLYSQNLSPSESPNCSAPNSHPNVHLLWFSCHIICHGYIVPSQRKCLNCCYIVLVIWQHTSANPCLLVLAVRQIHSQNVWNDTVTPLCNFARCSSIMDPKYSAVLTFSASISLDLWH